jgi:hypothetical protein
VNPFIPKGTSDVGFRPTPPLDKTMLGVQAMHAQSFITTLTANEGILSCFACLVIVETIEPICGWIVRRLTTETKAPAVRS